MGDADSRVSLQDDDRRSESMAKIDAQQIARAVFCGLAVTCLVVMYISADGAQEYVQEVVKGHDAGTSVDSTDVLKAGQIYTETPSGRMRLMDYFNGVERRIALELANRRADVASVRAQMARDFAFNAAARSKLKRNMLHKMAVNAKTCRDNLNTAMRQTQEKFAKKARLANRRWWATMKRDRKTISMIKSDSRQASRNLRLSVSTWQRATSAWAAATISAKDRVIDYRGKKKGSLSSVGDLLATLGALDSVKIRAAPGLGLGGGKAPPLFAGKKIKEAKSLSKINGLVNEFTRSVGQVRMRWPLGLGKYLLDKLEESMMTRGVLEVDKIAGKRGNFVFINGRSVGLSNKLNDFSKLSSGMTAYESTLAKLTAQLTKSSKGKKPAGKIVVKPPEWQGK